MNKQKEKIKKYWKRLLKLFFLILLPIILTTFIYYPPFKKYRVNDVENRTYIFSVIDINKEFKKNLFAELLQAPLEIDLYDICLNNKMVIINNGKILENTESKGSLFINITSIDEKYKQELSAKPGSEDCVHFRTENQGFRFGDFRAFAPIAIDLHNLKNKICDDEWCKAGGGSIDLNDSDLYIQRNRFSLTLRYFFNIIYWCGLLLLIRQIIIYIKRNKK